MHTINASLQLIPLTSATEAVELIDQAIALVRESGLRYEVTAFDTQVEGSMEQIQALISRIYTMNGFRPGQDVLLQIKMHWRAGESVFMDQKTAAHRNV